MKKAKLRLVPDFKIEPPDLNVSKNEFKAPEVSDLEVFKMETKEVKENLTPDYKLRDANLLDVPASLIIQSTCIE